MTDLFYKWQRTKKANLCL